MKIENHTASYGVYCNGFLLKINVVLHIAVKFKEIYLLISRQYMDHGAEFHSDSGPVLDQKLVICDHSTAFYPVVNYVHPPWGCIYYFCFFRRPMSVVRCPASGVRCPASRMVSTHLKEKY